MHYNKLNPAELERLAILSEECAEVIKIIGKIVRHGYESYDPTGKEPGTNREMLEVELGHMMAMNKVLAEAGDVNKDSVVDSMTEKIRKTLIAKTYIHHQ